MHKGKFPSLNHITLVLVVLLIGLTVSWAAGRVDATGNDSGSTQRADLIWIDTLAAQGPLERTPVAFLHDKHTQALEKQKKDCQTCHIENEGTLSPNFKRPENPQAQSRNEIMDIYHDNCIACHTENTAQGQKSGPVTCGECHLEKTELTALREPMGLDKSLHYRHVQAHEKKCEQCHHEYDATAKKLYYEKGKEGSCRYCHKSETEENRIAGRLAAHFQCIGCHREKLAKNLSAGPVECQGCHSKEGQEKIEKVSEIPRMERNQPDAVLIRAAAEAAPEKIPSERVAPVAFDHKAHESYNDTCRSCHHASLAACSSCHTPSGHKDGEKVRLSQAMHQRDADPSCIGCHAKQQEAPQCAGCHKAIKTSSSPKQDSCNSCHLEGPESLRSPLSKEEAESMALTLLKSSKPKPELYPMEDIPEKVVIAVLSEKYEPVELPHRKIINKLIDNIKDDKIAEHFHADAGTLCQGCHHNSPPSKTPPKCTSCHGEPFGNSDAVRSGLMGAYHQQCFNCHANMGIEKPDSRNCTTCHTPKKAT